MKRSVYCLTLALFASVPVRATVYSATPANYQVLLSSLRPGDTLALAAGTYSTLTISNLNGTASAWITIAGPTSGSPARIVGSTCCNTVEIINSSYVAIQNLTIDSLGIAGVFGVSAKGGTANVTHDVLLQNNTFVGQNGSQQTVAISTKIPTWGWIIRGNTISGAGTGLYLGNSDGTDPFFDGIIEDNLIQNTIGYSMQVKWQLPRPAVAGMPTGPSQTTIRNNVFIKTDQPSPDGDRPNLLVGGFPDSGAGSTDSYQIYGNFFDHNPREALFQGSGRISLHDNIFVDGYVGAIVLKDQDLPLKVAYVYNNTVYTQTSGIVFGTAASIDDAVTGNLVFASTPISGSIAHSSSNTVDTFGNAAQYVNGPSFTLGSMDFYPRVGMAQGPSIDLTKFAGDPDSLIDFNGTSKTAAKQSIVFRGAYAGEGTNPGWRLQAAIKPSGIVPVPSPTPTLTTLQCSPLSLISGQTTNCTVSINGTTSAAVTIALTSSDSAVTVPSAVSVAAGATSASFMGTANALVSIQSAILTASLNGVTASVSLTVTPTPTMTTPGSSTFYLKSDATEVAGVVSGSVVTPSVGPSNAAGQVVINGTGSVNFAPAQTGNGVYFLNCCSNANNAYYKFTGTGIGSIFPASQGQVTFYLKSRYSWAQRQALGGARYAFDVKDGSAVHQLSFMTQPVSGYMVFYYTVWGKTLWYYVPAGSEDQLFGVGSVLKVSIGWNAGTAKLYLNDTLIQTGAYPAPTPNWAATSVFDIGAYETAYGGYNTLDDILDEFTVSGAAATVAAPAVSMTAPTNAASVTGAITVSANATSSVGISAVQFKLDGANLGNPVSGSGPAYSTSWNTATAPNGTHTLTAVATDATGNSTTAVSIAVTVSNTAAPPVISSVAASAATSGATITWTTDHASDSQVNYGTTGSYGASSPLNSTLVTSHSVTLSGLAASTTYHYQVLSRDAAGLLATSADYTFTTSAVSAPPPPASGTTLQLHLDASEVSGTANGSVITPAAGPSGFTGQVVVNGSGSVNFGPAQTGNGAYFLNCCSNANNAYYNFTGTGIGSVFPAAQGQVTFYLKSRYSWAQRQALGGARYAFDVKDGSAVHQLSFMTQPVSGYMVFYYTVWGKTLWYYVPAGSEDQLFGVGSVLKVSISWNAGTAKLYLNDTLIQTGAYPAATPNWAATSVFDIGAYETAYGGYNVLDDILDEFTVSPTAQ